MPADWWGLKIIVGTVKVTARALKVTLKVITRTNKVLSDKYQDWQEMVI